MDKFSDTFIVTQLWRGAEPELGPPGHWNMDRPCPASGNRRWSVLLVRLGCVCRVHGRKSLLCIHLRG